MFLLLDEVGAADETDGASVAEGGEKLEHGRGNVLERVLVGAAGARGGGGIEWWGGERAYATGGRECAIDVEEADCVLDGAVF